MRGGGGRGAAAVRRLAVELAADVTDEGVDALLVEAVLEGGHPVAARDDLVREVLVRVLAPVLAEVRDLELRAVLQLEGAARAVGLVAVDAEAREVSGGEIGRASCRERG